MALRASDAGWPRHWDCWVHPCTQPFRADALQGQPFGCPDSLPANPSNPSGFSAPMLSVAQIKRPPLRAAFLFVWRREGDRIDPNLTS